MIYNGIFLDGERALSCSFGRRLPETTSPFLCLKTCLERRGGHLGLPPRFRRAAGMNTHYVKCPVQLYRCHWLQPSLAKNPTSPLGAGDEGAARQWLSRLDTF